MASPRTVDRIDVSLRVAGVLSIAGALAFRRLGDFDLPWHLAFGRAIVETRSIPRIDDFAYTHRPIQYAEFVSDLLLYGIVRFGGLLGLQIFSALCAVAVLALLWALTRRYAGVAPLVLAVALAAMNAWILARPASISFVLMAAFLLFIDGHRSAPTPREARRWLAALVPLQLLWVNVHGFSVLGLALLGGYAAYRVAARAAQGRLPALLPREDGSDAAFTVGVALAGALVSMVNLAGPLLLLGPIRTESDFHTITEWATPTFGFLFRTEPAVGVMAVLLLLAFVFGREPRSLRRLPSAFDLMLCLGAVALGASAVRLLALAAVLTAPFIARRLAWAVPPTTPTRLAGALAIPLAGAYMVLRPVTSLGVGFEPSHFPEGCVQYIRSAQPRGHMWNFLPFGGYLIWRLYPEYRVLVDGRSAWVHDPALLRRVVQSSNDPAAFQSLARDFDMQFAVSRAAEGEFFGNGVASSPDWQMVYWDDVGAVYVRRDGPNAPLAAKGYSLFRHLTPPGQILTWAMTRPKLADAISHDAALAVAQAPQSPRAAFADACAGIALRDERRVAAAFSRLAALVPGNPALAILQSAWLQASGTPRP